ERPVCRQGCRRMRADAQRSRLDAGVSGDAHERFAYGTVPRWRTAVSARTPENFSRRRGRLPARASRRQELHPEGRARRSLTRVLIAGLERPDHGRILSAHETFASAAERAFVPPEKRRIGMVFQSLALWPHLTAFENVAYPLRIRGVPARAIAERVNGALEM